MGLASNAMPGGSREEVPRPWVLLRGLWMEAGMVKIPERAGSSSPRRGQISQRNTQNTRLNLFHKNNEYVLNDEFGIQICPVFYLP